MNNITEWTDALRYQDYEDWSDEYLSNLKTQQRDSPWRFAYHIQPETGLLNDPNGFSYFDGQWHLFYQAYPFGPVHGLKSWYHLTSKNLVDWQRDQLRLLPDTSFDSHGVYSGSALPVDDKLFLAFTGNARDKNWERHATQLGAWMTPDYHVEKLATPLIPAPPTGYTQHFRDPQVFVYEENYYLLMGTQNDAKEGKVLLYKGTSLTEWELVNELHFSSEQMGYMIECPNLVFVDDKPVLIFCPQGLDKQTFDYQNIYPNLYVIADDFDPESATLITPSDFHNLDEGFDVYATQAFQAPNGRALSVGWVGLPDVTYPSDQEGWAHCLSLVRELRIIKGQLYQQPVAELETLRQAVLPMSDLQGVFYQPESNCYELTLTIPADEESTLTLFASAEHDYGFDIHCDAKNGMITVDRGRMALQVNPEFGTSRTMNVAPNAAIELRLFVDGSICELFVNEGERVCTSRVFPKKEDTTILLDGVADNSTLWSLRSIHLDD